MAFQDNTELAEFVFSDDVRSIGNAAFYGCTKLESFYYTDGGEKVKNGEINDYAQLDNGVLYVKLNNGDLTLMSIPAGANISTFMLKERTTAISDYAASANKTIRNVILADSLRSIGNFAFYGCTSLESVEFRSFTAPTLENYFVQTRTELNQIIPDSNVIESDPGYDLLHSQVAWTDDTLCYYNFIDLAGKFRPIKMILPSNLGVVGYDSVIYEAIFGKQESASISNYVAMDENLAAFIDGAKAISRIPTIMLSDETLVNNTISALEATSMKGTDYGYTPEEWKALVNAVYNAKDEINALKGIKPSAPTTEPTDGGLAGWAIALIVVAAVIVVAAGVVIALLLVKKQKAGKK